jgi:hypothetical protein
MSSGVLFLVLLEEQTIDLLLIVAYYCLLGSYFSLLDYVSNSSFFCSC